MRDGRYTHETARGTETERDGDGERLNGERERERKQETKNGPEVGCGKQTQFNEKR